LAGIEIVHGGGRPRRRIAERRQKQSADNLVHDQALGKAKFRGHVCWSAPVDNVFVAQPISGAQELGGEYVCLDFLAFARRVAFDPGCTALDCVAAEPDG